MSRAMLKPAANKDSASRAAARKPRTKESKGFEVVSGEAIEGAMPELDRLIHERIRLGIVSALAVNESLTFNDLKALLDTTDGNLSVHARKLEEAEYITCVKSFQGRMPKTAYRLTASGRRSLDRYLNHMEALIRATRG
jgi:DNA-binding transcriptional ArsR family regulator